MLCPSPAERSVQPILAGTIGTSSVSNGQRKIYVYCDEDFYNAFLAVRGYVYSRTEGLAYLICDDCKEYRELELVKSIVHSHNSTAPRSLQPLPNQRSESVAPHEDATWIEDRFAELTQRVGDLNIAEVNRAAGLWALKEAGRMGFVPPFMAERMGLVSF